MRIPALSQRYLVMIAGAGLLTAAASHFALAAFADDLEDFQVQKILGRAHVEVDHSPEGKKVVQIIAVSDEVFGSEDPWPLFLNVFHTVTLPSVIENELAFAVGDVWTTDLVSESERNLRARLVVSMAKIVALKAERENEVKVMIVTKDLWSLRLNQDFSVAGSTLEYLELQLEESNFLGRRKALRVSGRMDLGASWLTQQYDDPHIASTQWAGFEELGIGLNRQTGAVEGGKAHLVWELPVRSIRQEWSGAVDLSTSVDQLRIFSNGKLANIKSAQTNEVMPYQYFRGRSGFDVRVDHGLGEKKKHVWSFGWNLSSFRNVFSNAPATLSSLGLSDLEAKYLPVSEQFSQPYFRYHYYENTFHEEVNYDTYSLTEDVRLGPEMIFETGVANSIFGFDTDYVKMYGLLGFAEQAEGFLYGGSVSFGSRYQPNKIAGQPWINQVGRAKFRVSTPAIFLNGRLHLNLYVNRRWFDRNRAMDGLGGDQLRGFPSKYFIGSSSWLGSLEWRSAPLKLSTLRLGYAVFTEVGDAFETAGPVEAYGSSGLGLRLLIPEYNRAVLRADLGFPWQRPVGVDAFAVSVKFGQAF